MSDRPESGVLQIGPHSVSVGKWSAQFTIAEGWIILTVRQGQIAEPIVVPLNLEQSRGLREVLGVAEKELHEINDAILSTVGRSSPHAK